MVSGIYAIVSPSGKRYIGSAVNFRKRWGLNKTRLRDGAHHNPGLLRAYKKYGHALQYVVLEECPPAELLKREQFYLDAADWSKLYNVCKSAGSALGVKRRPETIAKLRGRKFSAESRLKMSESATARPARAQTPETRLKMSEKAAARDDYDLALREKMSAKRNTSGFAGVSFCKLRNKWRAYACVGGKPQSLGYFPTAEAASAERLSFLANHGVI